MNQTPDQNTATKVPPYNELSYNDQKYSLFTDRFYRLQTTEPQENSKSQGQSACQGKHLQSQLQLET